MQIDPKIEKPARDMLGHAVRGELEQMAGVAQAIGDERFQECLGLYLRVAAYVAIDVCGQQWPSDAEVRKIAKNMAGVQMEFDLREANVYDYLARAALGFEPLIRVIPEVESAAVPILVTATLLVSYRHKSQDWWDYLEMIERALEAAAATDLSVLPALLLRSRRAASQNLSSSEALESAPILPCLDRIVGGY
jgi:hypothetical protein